MLPASPSDTPAPGLPLPPRAAPSPDPDKALARATQLFQEGRREAALLAAEDAAREESLPALLLLAAILFALDRPQAALVACNRALARDRDNAPALLNTGRVLERLGDLPAAEHAFARALAAAPRWPEAMTALALLLGRSGRHPEALALLAQAVELLPEDPEARFNLADMTLAQGDAEAAARHFTHCLAQQPGHLRARLGLAQALAARGEVEAAQAHIAQAAAQDPQALARYRSPFLADLNSEYPSLDPRRIYLAIAYNRLCQGDWSCRRETRERLTRWLAVDAIPALDDPDLPFAALAMDLEAEEQLRLARQVAARLGAAQPVLPRFRRRPRQRLRIGYVSSDLRQHATGFLTRRLFALHDRERVDVYAYSTHAGDGSAVEVDIAASCDTFRCIPQLSPGAAAALIAQDEIDILVDLAGYTRLARSQIFAARPAPVQVAYLGYPCTTGAPWMDYAILDRSVLPPGEHHTWSEIPVYLPSTYFIYNDAQAVAPTPSRAEAGLPATGPVLCCFNGTWKIDPDTFGLWMGLLHACPESTLWLYGDHPATPQHLRREAAARGIAPERLVFAPPVPHEQHLARYRLADLCLDTPLCNGHTTTADALYAGCPVLTRPGRTMASRVAASLLRAAGLEGLITANAADYQARARELLAQPSALAEVRRQVTAARQDGTLFATERRVRELEAAYALMWERRGQAGAERISLEVALPGPEGPG